MSGNLDYGQVVDFYQHDGSYFAKILNLETERAHLVDLGTDDPVVDFGYYVSFKTTKDGLKSISTINHVQLPKLLQPANRVEGSKLLPLKIEASLYHAWRRYLPRRVRMRLRAELPLADKNTVVGADIEGKMALKGGLRTGRGVRIHRKSRLTRKRVKRTPLARA